MNQQGSRGHRNSTSRTQSYFGFEPRVYFENFPNSHSDTKTMRMVFGKYGVSGSIFIARKRNMRNLNFGFLTPEGSLSLHEALFCLNSVSIGNIGLRAYKSRYSSNTSVKDTGGVIGEFIPCSE